MSASVTINTQCHSAASVYLFNAILQVGCTYMDLAAAEKELKYLESCEGEKIKIDYLITNELNEKIGLRQKEDGNMEFVLSKETASAKETLNKVTQAYARLRIIDEVKRKGYQSVKEEKLPNGSIRLVVEKWR